MSNKYFLIDRMFSQHDRYLLKKLLDKVNEVDAEGDEAVVDIEALTSTVQALIDNPATEQLGIDTVAGSTTKYLSEKGTMEEIPDSAIIQLGIDLENGSTTKYLSEKGTMEEVPEPAVTQLGIDLENGSTTKYLSEKGTMEEVPAASGAGASAPLTNITYDQLTAAITGSTLTPGAKYLITDYQTVHEIPNSGIWDEETEETYANEINTGQIEPLLVTAISENELAPEAYSALFPDDVIYYSPTNDQTMVPGCTKGYIYRRVDTKQNNDIPFDFRQVKFRRWQISQPTWSAAETYAKGAVVKNTVNNVLLVSLQDGNLNNDLSDSAFWQKFVWDNLSYVAWNSEYFPIILDYSEEEEWNYLTPNANYQDYKMWANDADYATAFSNKIDTPLSGLIKNANTVIFGADFSSNSIGAYFKNNTVGAYFNNNSIGAGFGNNSIGAGFGNNSIEADFSNNAIGENFSNNSIGYYFNSNSIEFDFYTNSIEANFTNNSIGANFSRNSIEAGFSSNSIGFGFSSNSIGTGFNRNSIWRFFRNNSTSANISKNLSAVTELYNKQYPHELIATDGGGVLIRWYDSSGVSQTQLVP